MPPYPGLASAIGLLTTDVRYEHAATVWQPLDGLSRSAIEDELARLGAAAKQQLAADGFGGGDVSLELAADCRYVGQGYELRVPLPAPPADDAWVQAVSESFHAAHADTYGRRFGGQRVQIVNLRVVGVGSLRHFASAGPHDASGPVTRADAGTTRPASPPVTAEAVFGVDGKAQGLTAAIVSRPDLRPGDRLAGPAIVEQPDTTIVLPPSWQAVADKAGNLLVTRTGAAA